MQSMRDRIRFRAYRQSRARAEHLSVMELHSNLGPIRADHVRVVAPTVLSMVDNPEETLRFVAKLSNYYDKRQKVHVSLANVKRIGQDAVVVLVAALIRFKAAKIGFYGDLPKDDIARRLLIQSRFFESLYHKNFEEQDVYEIGSGTDIHTHANKVVDAVLSARIIESAAKTVWGAARRCQGVQRVFLELMQNTNNHASLYRQGERHWWTSVNHRIKDRKTSFTFVDFGVGVFNSLDNKKKGNKWFDWRNKLVLAFKPPDNAAIFKLILDGDLHKTVTGEYFRGKGLPGIREVFQRGGISKLKIITNDVYADVERNEYRVLKTPFDGTLVYWEVQTSNQSSAA